MYSTNSSTAVQWRKDRPTFNAHSVKEPVVRFKRMVRTNTLRAAWILVTFAPMIMTYNAARADESAETLPHKVVSFRDLNLDTPEGSAVLYRRIMSAAHDVCGDPDRYDPSQRKLEICVKDAVSRAITQVDRPMLTRL